MKKGFTLIELLAVIVILAVIAVIAVPIVLNIINDAKESATLRSAEMYIKSAELSIAQSTLKNKNITDGTYNLKDGDICLNTDCTDKLEVEVSGKVPDSGTITMLNGSISELSLVLNEKEIYKNSNDELVFVKKLNDICKPAKEQYFTTNPLEAGYEYECEVKPGTKYNFFVLSKEDGSINLIMDRNICEDGSLTSEGKTCSVSWGSTSKGPITAMEFLNNATSAWVNIQNLDITYDDESGQFTDFKITGKARLPYYSEVDSYDWDEGTNGYLYEYLDQEWWDSEEGWQPTNYISNIYGYWLFSSLDETADEVMYVEAGGNICNSEVINDMGIRPVINLKI